MHLKRLELKGFKSFASKITMNLETGVTGVVGPNGSGKSNISDGIKWVLGEQSPKTLRGAKMEDVIFSGTEKQKPLGMAEVSLILDNEDGGIPIDYSEVKITRRAYRSGENEYLINQSPCRLKDIRELFMDTGIGKDGYSIVGQGKIDEILSHKAEDRRKVIEEAVGIVKYKSRKEEAQKKLKGTDENLQRLSDILRELGGRMGPLKEQKEKAEKYLKLYETLKEGEVKQILEHLSENDGKMQRLEQEKQEIREEIHGLKVESNKVEAEITAMEEGIEAHQKNYQQKETHYYEKKDEIQEIEGLKRINEGEIEHLESRKEELENRIRQGERRKEEVHREYTKARKDLEELKAYLTTLEKDLQSEKSVYDENHQINRHRKEDVEKIKSEIIEDMNLLSDWKVDYANLESLKNSIDQRKNQIKEALEDHLQRQKEKEQDFEELQRTLEDLLKNRKVQEETGESLMRRKEEVERDLKVHAGKIEEKNRHHQHRNSKIQLLKNLEAAKEGFHRSVKEVLKKAKKDTAFGEGLYGAVADLIKVPKGYELAIETALGYAMQNLIVEDEEKGKALIHYCKTHKLGRITVLPKTTISGKSLQKWEQSTIDQEPKASVALDIINYPRELEAIFSSLLGKVVVLPDLDSGVRMARQLKHRIKIVTREGDVLNPGGSMTGGSQHQKNHGLLSRKRELKSLLVEAEKEEKNLADLQQRASELEGQKKDFDRKKTESDQKIQGFAIEEARVKEQLHQQKQQLQDFTKEIADRKTEFSQLEKTEAEYKEEHRGLEEKIKNLQNRLSRNRAHIQVEEKDLVQQINKIEGLKERIQEMQVRKASTEEQIKALENKLQDQEQELRRQEKAVREDQKEIENGLEEKEHMRQEIEKQEAAIKQGAEYLERLKKQGEEYKEKEQKTLRSKKEIEKKHQSQRDVIKDREEALYKLEMQGTKLEVQLENLHQSLWEKYEMSYEQGLQWIQSKNGKLSPGEIQGLKKEIKNLGNINIEAIEEYREAKERFEFLDQQQKDLLEAKKSLNRIIREMESTMKIQFLDQLAVIKKEFNQTFVRLFGGGKADLVLEDENDPLETGINILARPPGKKLQSLSLLSGGERALTAIALLFAILKIKPSPFCVLDEIEAALDESNVYRFAGFLQELAIDTQFIVVTHRKGTMEAADTLYGVTMEKEGISKLVSVKMKDYLDEEKAI